MKMGLTKDEIKIIKSMDTYIDFNPHRPGSSIFWRSKEYRIYLEMVEKKENKNPGYEHLNIHDKKYKGFEVKRTGL